MFVVGFLAAVKRSVLLMSSSALRRFSARLLNSHPWIDPKGRPGAGWKCALFLLCLFFRRFHCDLVVPPVKQLIISSARAILMLCR